MAMWALLKDRPETRALYADDKTETADKIPFSVRQALANFPFEIDFTSYDNPGGYKEFFGVVSKIVSKDPELKTLWSKWLKLPFVVTDGVTKKHTNPSLFKLFQTLADTEAEILVQVQNEMLAKEDEEEAPEPIPEPEPIPVIEVKQEAMDVDEPTTMRVRPSQNAAKAAAFETAPVSGVRIAESPTDILRRINANILKQTTANVKTMRLPAERVTFKQATGSNTNRPLHDPVLGIRAILQGYQKE
jgi:hypothetical protein